MSIIFPSDERDSWSLSHLGYLYPGTTPVPVRVNHKVSTTGDGTRKQGDVEISNFPISLRDGLVIDVFSVCEFKGSIRAPGGWNNGVRHSNDVLQARAKVKNNKYKDVYGLVGSWARARGLVGTHTHTHTLRWSVKLR